LDLTSKKPSRKLIRQARNERGPRTYEAAEIQTLLNAAEPNMKAMILLGINCGFGQTDLANLTSSAVDFDKNMIDYPRQKTAVQRRCPIWPETAEALQSVIKNRPTPKSELDMDIIFITKYGHRWVRESETEKRSWTDAVQLQFGKLSRNLDLHKPRFGFYTLRHTFETIAGESADQVAVDFIMGHARDDMSSIYRERIGLERLQKIVHHVHDWVFPPKDSET
jgi:integrase